MDLNPREMLLSNENKKGKRNDCTAGKPIELPNGPDYHINKRVETEILQCLTRKDSIVVSFSTSEKLVVVPQKKI